MHEEFSVREQSTTRRWQLGVAPVKRLFVLPILVWSTVPVNHAMHNESRHG